MLDDYPTVVAQTIPDQSVDVDPRWLRCARCLARIARGDAGCAFDGGHVHHFSNPHGYHFEVGLYAAAPGLVVRGDATEYFSWFVGYTWQLGLCAECGVHLGWMFDCLGSPGPGEPTRFSALVLERLVLGTFYD